MAGFIPERIVKAKDLRSGTRLFFIKWKDFPSTDNTWQKEEETAASPGGRELIAAFDARVGSTPKDGSSKKRKSEDSGDGESPTKVAKTERSQDPTRGRGENNDDSAMDAAPTTTDTNGEITTSHADKAPSSPTSSAKRPKKKQSKKMEVVKSEGGSDGDEFEVERIVEEKTESDGTGRKYLVKWRGFLESDNTWESESNLQCPDLLREFKKGRVVERVVNVINQETEPNAPRNLKVLVKWTGHASTDWISSMEAREQCPLQLIDFYESRLRFSPGEKKAK